VLRAHDMPASVSRDIKDIRGNRKVSLPPAQYYRIRNSRSRMRDSSRRRLDMRRAWRTSLNGTVSRDARLVDAHHGRFVMRVASPPSIKRMIIHHSLMRRVQVSPGLRQESYRRLDASSEADLRDFIKVNLSFLSLCVSFSLYLSLFLSISLATSNSKE